MIHKRILVPQRLRHPPATGWSWVDRRFLREHGDLGSAKISSKRLKRSAVVILVCRRRGHCVCSW